MYRFKMKSSMFFMVFLVFLSLASNVTLVQANNWPDGVKDYAKSDKDETNASNSVEAYGNKAGLSADQIKELNEEISEKNSKVLNSLNLTKLMEKDGPWERFMTLYDDFLNYVLGFGVISSFLVFIFIMVRMTTASDHPVLRRKLMVDSLVSLSCTALLGGIGLFVKMFMMPFRDMFAGQLFLLNDWRISFAIILYEYRILVTVALSASTIILILMFILGFMKLGASSGNPQARKKAISGIFVTGLATAALGSCTLVVGMFYNFFS